MARAKRGHKKVITTPKTKQHSIFWWLTIGLLFWPITLTIELIKLFKKSNVKTAYSNKISNSDEDDHECEEVLDDDEEEYKCSSFKIVGVTFENDDGSSRQENLKSLKNKQINNDDIELIEYVFNNLPALKVIIKGLEIGNISKNEVSNVKKVLKDKKDITLSIYGGGMTDDGVKKSLGAEINIYQ